ncbi:MULTISPECIES: hypothetical protein [unclassified Gordonia (in: high G+C Gram-positive bacteria)]|uniref:hypothetical protein n=1 Tax=unclassified Gordonia (in: high G+C Gram-positive bacteria) TaxID=2657482 RepID=UPI0007EB0993|nr:MULTISPECIES: hypothetical protein [unclassified Gordonia (in: high G+C Gram-positive bacteria)]OBC05325.1 hypothetical protein A5786_11475 [Gordonia sp. 852002-50816_SCH5313054-a]OBC08829.1 hypothetical protein A5785_05585 [Gordonia sp. 852002-50395_SCH5434458]OBC15559.1 hypothetical protein A5788_14405 [Gordonia sp. 852002-50816_SCH5313054-c]
MRAIRVAWLAMAVAALGYAVACGFMPVGEVTVSCGKSGELSVAGAHAGATCEDSIFAALGPRRLIEMGVLLASPPLIAAVALRVWVSWLVVPAMAVLVFVGVANWADFWLLLSLGALVLLVASIVVATAHLAVRARRDSHRARGAAAGM